MSRSFFYLTDLPFRQILSIAIKTVWVKFCNITDTLQARILFWRFGVKVGCGLSVNGYLRCFCKGTIIIGKNVRINSGPDHNFVGGDRRMNIWVNPRAKLEIEEGAAISNSTIVVRVSVLIRQFTYIGGGCEIYDNDFHEIDRIDRKNKRGNIGAAPVEIGPHAFIGGHTIILKGVNIGEGSVIGAGSLVTKNVPPYQLWAGRPAKLVRKLFIPTKEHS